MARHYFQVFGATLVAAAAFGGCGSDGAVSSTSSSGGSTSSSASSSSDSSTTSGVGGAGGQGSSTTASSGTGGSGGASCPPLPPSCNAPLPDPGPALDWNNVGSYLVVAEGDAQHRGRDLFLNPGDPQWVLAKFAYGALDDDLKGEQVDIWLSRDCGADWQLLGSATTTNDGDHATVEGVDDTGGRVFFPIPAADTLGLGRHRLHLVVRGDLTATDVFIEVVAPGSKVFVSDVDGTLTTTENAEFGALLTGSLPDMNPGASAALTLLAEKGYRPFYLTARPEWLGQRTRDFLDANGFPPGIVHTTLTFEGALGNAAETYKTDELSALQAKSLVPTWVFGNTSSDAAAYENTGILPLDQRVFYQYDDTFGGRRIEAYTELLGEFGSLPCAQ